MPETLGYQKYFLKALMAISGRQEMIKFVSSMGICSKSILSRSYIYLVPVSWWQEAALVSAANISQTVSFEKSSWKRPEELMPLLASDAF